MKACNPTLVLCLWVLAGCSGTREGEPDAPARMPALRISAQLPPSTPTTLPPAPEPPADGRLQAEARDDEQSQQYAERYPLHGVAFHRLAQVFHQPGDPTVAGYLRRGSRFRAAPGVSGPGCDGLWHEVDGGGFVCAGRGFVLGRSPRSFSPAPAPPDLNAQLPYRYARTVARDVPQYYRLPTAEEETVTAAAIVELRQLRERLAAAEVAKAAAGVEQTMLHTTTAAVLDQAAPLPPAPSPSAAGPASTEPEPEPSDPLAGVLPEYVRTTMSPGFYVSVDGYEQAPSGRRFARTVRGAYVAADRLVPATPSPFHGTALPEGLHVPLGLVHFREAATLIPAQAEGTAGPQQPGEPLGRFSTFSITGPPQEVGGKQYYPTASRSWVEARAVRVARRIARPSLVPRTARWVDVDLREQVLVAYEGDTPVFTTLVATGKAGHETPTGLYRLHAKHVSTTMDGEDGTDEMYSIEDVPWTMYFKGSLALHGAFWHDRFGRVRSHGCVNLAPADARFLFHWTEPALPPGFHGVMPHLRARSTYVLIRDGSENGSFAER